MDLRESSPEGTEMKVGFIPHANASFFQQRDFGTYALLRVSSLEFWSWLVEKKNIKKSSKRGIANLSTDMKNSNFLYENL
jgi:hypothetical protein